MLARSDVELANEFVLKGHSDHFFFPLQNAGASLPLSPPPYTHTKEPLAVMAETKDKLSDGLRPV